MEWEDEKNELLYCTVHTMCECVCMSVCVCCVCLQTLARTCVVIKTKYIKLVRGRDLGP